MQSVRADAVSVRQRLEVAIERAIAALDALDGDADLEPSLGAPDAYGFCFVTADRWVGAIDQRKWSAGGDTDEREAIDEREPEDTDGAWGERIDLPARE